jgi:hypothetical protein
MIFTFGRRLALVAAPNSAPRSTPTVQYTIAESIGMLGYQKCEATSAYRFGPTSVRQFRDIVMVTQAHNRCYEPDMVILKVGLLHEPPVLCTSSKTYISFTFHFKISLNIYTPPYIAEKQEDIWFLFT